MDIKRNILIYIPLIVFFVLINSFVQSQPTDPESVDQILTFELPIDLNVVTKGQLLEFNLFSTDQILSFFEFRENYGPFIGLEELQVIPYWENSYKNIDFDSMFKVTTRYRPITNQLIAWTQYKVRWDDAKTDQFFLDNIWVEGNKRLHAIYRRNNGVRAGIDLETDMRETGVDHLSYFIQVPIKDKWSFSIGNHQIFMTDQLVFGRGNTLRGYGNQVESLYWSPSITGIFPTLHTETVLGFNGIQGLYHTKKLSFSAFAFYNQRDMLIHPLIPGAGKSIKLTGLHQTDKEKELKNNLIEKGTCMNFNIQLFKGKYQGKIWHLYRNWNYPLSYKPFTITNPIQSFTNIVGVINEVKILQGVFVAQSIWSQFNGWGFSFQYLRPISRYVSLGFRGQWHNNLLELQTSQVAQKYIQSRIEFRRRKKWLYTLQLSSGQIRKGVKERLSYWKPILSIISVFDNLGFTL